MVRYTYPGGRFSANAATLKFLVEWAYGIQPFQHSGGPSWMGTERYDVVAKAAGEATDAEMKLMLRTLLADRFQLKFHHESKKLPVYVISLGKTPPKLFPPKDGEAHFLKVSPQVGQDGKPTSYHVAATRFSLTQLTDIFARQLGSLVVNETGLDGDFDFSMDLTPDDNRPHPLDPSLLIGAMREQLGLTLKSRTAPVDFLVIDSAGRVAAGN